MSMLITVVDVDNRKLFEGAKVLCRNGQVKTIHSIPAGMTLYEAVLAGNIDMSTQVEYDTVMNNRHLFTLVKEDEE